MWNRLVGIVKRRTGGTLDAEDLVQEAYLKLLARDGPVQNADGFVVKVAENLAISNVRKADVRMRAHSDHAIRDLISPPLPSPAEVFDARERLRIVEAEISKIPPRARQIFLSHRVDGKSYSAIAEELGISVSAVEKNMARAMTHLALKLQDFRRKHDARD